MKRRKAKLLKPSVAYNFLLHHNSMSKKKKENFLAVIQTPSLRKQKTINIFKLDSPNQVRSSRRNDGLKNYFVWDGFQTAIVILFRKLFIPKKGDSPQRAQRKIKIKQGNKLLFSALLCALVK